nr:PREDICTED: uncharacterized protein LOC107079657 [Lepisosteus oculatus]
MGSLSVVSPDGSSFRPVSLSLFHLPNCLSTFPSLTQRLPLSGLPSASFVSPGAPHAAQPVSPHTAVTSPLTQQWVQRPRNRGTLDKRHARRRRGGGGGGGVAVRTPDVLGVACCWLVFLKRCPRAAPCTHSNHAPSMLEYLDVYSPSGGRVTHCNITALTRKDTVIARHKGLHQIRAPLCDLNGRSAGAGRCPWAGHASCPASRSAAEPTSTPETPGSGRTGRPDCDLSIRCPPIAVPVGSQEISHTCPQARLADCGPEGHSATPGSTTSDSTQPCGPAAIEPDQAARRFRAPVSESIAAPAGTRAPR